MRAAVNTVACLCVALATQVAPALAAEDEGARETGSGQEGADRWVPSLAVISGVTIQKWNADASSQICQGCPIPDPMMGEVALRRPQSGDDLSVTPFVGGSLEVMTPELPYPYSPRLFVGFELMGSFGFERAAAVDGDPGRLASPLPAGANTFYGEDAALGQGTETVAELGSVIYGLHAGVAIPFELFDRPLRFRTSFGWIRYDIDVSGLIVDAECLQVGNATRCNNTISGAGFQREIRLRANDSGTYDGIGPGFELELDTGRYGPIGSSLLLGGRAYYILGDRDMSLNASQSFNDTLGMDATQGRFGFEIEEWMFRLGIGLRFQWLGPDD